jgi:hypothetical protein
MRGSRGLRRLGLAHSTDSVPAMIYEDTFENKVLVTGDGTEAKKLTRSTHSCLLSPKGKADVLCGNQKILAMSTQSPILKARLATQRVILGRASYSNTIRTLSLSDDRRNRYPLAHQYFVYELRASHPTPKTTTLSGPNPN